MRLKLVLILFFLGLWFYFLSLPAFASSDFDISNHDFYQILDTGKAKVTQSVVIKNKTKYVYTPTYTIGVAFSDVDDLKATNSAGLLVSQIIKNGKVSTIQILFPKKNIGVGSKNAFTISYTTDQISKKTKGGWEIVIPGLVTPSMFLGYSVDVSIPEVFGYPIIITPTQKSEKNNVYTFQINDFAKSGIYMLFKKYDSKTPREVIRTELPNNALFGFAVKGDVSITNATGEIIKGKTLDIESQNPLKSAAYEINDIPPYGTVVVPINLGSTPLLTIGAFKVKISFDGNEDAHYVNVGLIPDYYLIFLGGIISLGSFIVATVAVKTWRLHFQKRTK